MGDDTALPAARRPGSATLLVPAPALRPGDEPGDRPPPRAIVDVVADADRTAGAAARGERGRRPPGRAGELLPLPVGGRGAPRDRSRPRSSRTRRSATRAARIAAEAIDARRAGTPVLVLTDAAAAPAVPCLLAVGAVQQRLVAAGRRSDVSLVVVSDEPRDSHHVACLLGYGADAVCPRLALETIAALAAADRLGGDQPSPDEAQRRFRDAVEDGVLKVMAKMGIADVASYRGAQLFDALGLAHEVVDLCFTGTPSPLGGIGFDELERELRSRLGGREAREPGLRQVPAGRRAARDDAGGGRVAAGGRACAPPRRRGRGGTDGVRALRGARRRARAARAA